MRTGVDHIAGQERLGGSHIDTNILIGSLHPGKVYDRNLLSCMYLEITFAGFSVSDSDYVASVAKPRDA